MDRRQALVKIAKFLSQHEETPFINIGRKRYPTGWVYIDGLEAPSPELNTQHIAGSGRGKIALLYKAYEHLLCKPLAPHEQAIGDCVSHAYGLGVDILTMTQIAAGARERWVGEAATEMIYGGGRVEVAGGPLRWSDGMMGSWAANWLRKFGNLVRKEYVLGDERFDLRTYSGKAAKNYGRYGVPDILEPVAKEHPVKTTALVKTWSDLCDVICNGFPVAVCSNQGFNSTRDAEGFLKPQGSWAHGMCIIGVDDTKRPGALIQNSWGIHWVSGPTRYGQPVGSFWADANVIERMLAMEDSFALSNYTGFPRVQLPDYILH